MLFDGLLIMLKSFGVGVGFGFGAVIILSPFMLREIRKGPPSE